MGDLQIKRWCFAPNQRTSNPNGVVFATCFSTQHAVVVRGLVNPPSNQSGLQPLRRYHIPRGIEVVNRDGQITSKN